MTNLKFVKLNLHGNNTFQNTSFAEKKINQEKDTNENEQWWYKCTY